MYPVVVYHQRRVELPIEEIQDVGSPRKSLFGGHTPLSAPRCAVRRSPLSHLRRALFGGRRLVGEDVEPRCGETPAIERLDQGRLVNQPRAPY